MEIAARRRPAAQPSVRRVRPLQRAAGSALPYRARSRPASATVKARSPDRISVSSPGQPVAVQRQRSHPRGNHQAQAGPCIAQQVVKPVQHLVVGQQMQVIQDQCHRRVLGRQRRREPQQEDVAGVRSPRGGQRWWQGHTGPSQCRDDIGPEDPGRLSNSSRPTQATVPGSAAAHSARAVVLPAPAGPVTTVSGHHRAPCAISLVIRGRGTTQPGTPGAVIFVATIGTPAETAGRRAQVAARSAA